jgi:hypothetical protein
MNKDARLSKDKISSMYSHVVDIHNYEALGITYGGQKTNIGDALDQIINAVMFFSTSAEKPAFSRLYQMEYMQPEAAKILSELNGLQQRMFRIHKGTEVPDDLPAVSDAKHIFARLIVFLTLQILMEVLSRAFYSTLRMTWGWAFCYK